VRGKQGGNRGFTPNYRSTFLLKNRGGEAGKNIQQRIRCKRWGKNRQKKRRKEKWDQKGRNERNTGQAIEKATVESKLQSRSWERKEKEVGDQREEKK